MPSVGAPDAALLVVGLAPGLRGANRTGVPFTGDTAGALLRATLRECGLDPDSGSSGRCRITNAVRCVPPGNRPTAAEVAACRPFLAAELGLTGGRLAPRVVLCLGGVAHRAVVGALGLRPRDHPFAHGAVSRPPPGGGRPVLAASYHPSRYNLSTGRLNAAMLAAVVRGVRALLASPTAEHTPDPPLRASTG